MGNNMKAKKRVSLYKKQSVTGWAFLLPATLLIFAMNFYPMLQAFVLSFKTGIGNNQTWGGLSNYARLLKDGVFRTAITNNFFYLIIQVPVMLILAAGFGCSEQRKWNREQRKEMREMLRDYRQMAYLNDLTDAEFILFSDDVATALEGDYPVYATFVTMPGVEDTVQLVIVETVVEELQADARNMRHIFPYEQLVARKMLPAGLDHDQLHAFYNCLAGKVNSTFVTLDQFVNAVMADTVNTSTMQRLEGQCANDLFDWEITEVEVIETN